MRAGEGTFARAAQMFNALPAADDQHNPPNAEQARAIMFWLLREHVPGRRALARCGFRRAACRDESGLVACLMATPCVDAFYFWHAEQCKRPLGFRCAACSCC